MSTDTAKSLSVSQIRFLTKRVAALKTELAECNSSVYESAESIQNALIRDIADLEHRLSHAKLLASTYG